MIKNKILLVLIFQGFFGFSQNSSNDSIKLKEVIVSITKIKENIKNSPFAYLACPEHELLLLENTCLDLM